MFKYLTKKCKQKLGFTLMEVMVVVAILAVISMIAIPSVINMRKNMIFTQHNDYAKSIFMAAQANLTEMRSTGLLANLVPEEESANKAKAQNGDATGTPPANYLYTWNGDTSYFDYVLPANSIDSAVRNSQVIIEYNPAAGIVYSVFYYDDNDINLKETYASGGLTRDAEDRKDLLLGYYSVGNVDALEVQGLDVYRLAASTSFINAQEAVLYVDIPTQYTEEGTPVNVYDKMGSLDHYTSRLEVSLTITGESGNAYNVIAKGGKNGSSEDSKLHYAIDNTQVDAGGGTIIRVIIPLDSLVADLETNGSFTQLPGNSIIDETTNQSSPAIAPGDNVSITAEVTFYPDADDPIVMIESATIAGINPMYHSLTQNPNHDPNDNDSKPYILAVSNGRHLQNLDQLAVSIAEKIDSIVFVAQTEADVVTSTDSNAGDTEGDAEGSQPSSDPSEAAVKTASEIPIPSTPPSNKDGEGSETVNTEIAINWTDTVTYYGSDVKNFTPINNDAALSKVPEIIGNGVKITGLKIDTPVNSYAGLFASLKNTSVSGITLVDPTVVSTTTVNTSATGALIGKAEGVTITDCSVVDTTEDTTTETVTVGIAGDVHVGGLVGYATDCIFEKCSSDITVYSNGTSGYTVSGNTVEHYALGGLVGYAKGSSVDKSQFKACTTSAYVTASDAATVSGNMGGLVGHAVDTAFKENCSSDATVQSNIINHGNGKTDGFKNNLGGLVGRSEESTFSNCSSDATVQGAHFIIADKEVPISGHYIGGMVGLAMYSEFTGTITVTLDSLPQHAANVGGLAGYMSNSTIESNNVKVTLTGGEGTATIARFGGLAGDITNNSTIRTTSDKEFVEINLNGTFSATNAAGVAVGIEAACSVNDVMVLLDGTIKGTSAAGFAIEAGGTVTNCRIAPHKSSATINGITDSAGFVVTNKANITGSYMRGTVSTADSGQAAGFAILNTTNGRIRNCMANVTLKSGHAFVKDNDATVENCYGWLWGTDSSSALKITNNCSYSYFVNGNTNAMILYEKLKKASDSDTTATVSGESENIRDTDALTDVWALELLNAGETDPKNYAWSEGSNGYPYPELSFGHYGDHNPPVAGNYPYYIVYTETYSDSTTGTYTIDSTSTTHEDKLDDTKTITNTSYTIYCRSGQLSEVSDYFSEKTHSDDPNIPRLYSEYTQKSDKNYAGTVTISGNEVSLNTYCAPGNKIRTGEQFANISHDTDADYTVEKSIVLGSDYSAFNYDRKLNASSGVTIDASAISGNLIGTLKGTLSGLTITGLKAPMVSEISGGTVTGCTVSAEIPSGENVGIIAGTLSSGSTIKDSTATGSVHGSGDVGGVVGRSAGTLTNVTATLTSVSSDNSQTGALVGNASAGTISGCTVTAPEGLPFTNLPSVNDTYEGLTTKPTHYTTSSSFGEKYTHVLNINAQGLSMYSTENFNLDLVTGDVSISSSFLNSKAISLTPHYFYSVSPLTFDIAESNTKVIVPNRVETPTFSAFINYSEWHTTDYLFDADGKGNYETLEVKMTSETETKESEITDSEGNTTTTSTSETTYTLHYRAEGDTTEKTDSTTNIDSKIDLYVYQYVIQIPTSGTYVLFDSDKYKIWDTFGWVENTSTRSEGMIWIANNGTWTNYGSKANMTVNTHLSYEDKSVVEISDLTENPFYGYLFYVDAEKVFTRVFTANVLNN